MEKAFKNFFLWKNQPSTQTPLGERLLNTINNALNEVDDRVLALDTSKLDISVANGMIKSVEINPKTGVIKVTQLDGTIYTWDLNIEKIPVDLYMTKDAILVLETDDGETFTADLKGLIDVYIFDDSETIDFQETKKSDGNHVKAIVKNGSITEDKIQPNFLADVKTEATKAKQQAEKAEKQALLSQSYAVGGSGIREGESTDNSKYYSEKAKDYMNAAQVAAELTVPIFYIDFKTGCLMSETEAKGMEFDIEDGYFIGRTVES